MKNLLLTLFVLLNLTSCIQKKDSNIKKETSELVISEKHQSIQITESEYYGFFNDVLEDKTVIRNKILKYPDLKNNSNYWKQILLPLTKASDDKKMSEILTDSDIDFIFKQHASNKIIELNFDKLKIDNVSDKILKEVSDYLQSEDRSGKKKYNYFGIYDLTIPLFSEDKKTAFFEYRIYCGLLCAFDGIGVYKIINGKWESIGVIGNYTMS